MNTHYYLVGFGLGTFKFLFSHWSVYFAAWKFDIELNFLELFLPATLGALITMVICYFTSEKLMSRAQAKRLEKIRRANENGVPIKYRKKFTFMNKLIVRIKIGLGIYGVTILAPLFLSIPIGSIVCAKFYGDQKKTFPLMVCTVVGYSLLMTSLILILK